MYILVPYVRILGETNKVATAVFIVSTGTGKTSRTRNGHVGCLLWSPSYQRWSAIPSSSKRLTESSSGQGQSCLCWTIFKIVPFLFCSRSFPPDRSVIVLFHPEVENKLRRFRSLNDLAAKLFLEQLLFQWNEDKTGQGSTFWESCSRWHTPCLPVAPSLARGRWLSRSSMARSYS